MKINWKEKKDPNRNRTDNKRPNLIKIDLLFCHLLDIDLVPFIMKTIGLLWFKSKKSN